MAPAKSASKKSETQQVAQTQVAPKEEVKKTASKKAPKQEQKEEKSVDLELTAEEEEQLKKKLEELRKMDPFIYR